MLSINTNLSSMIVQNSMGQATSKLNQAIERMSTGFKINHASDNAANYSISTNMTTKMSAYMVAEDNVSMGLDMLTTASENLSQIESKLARLRALATQASNGTYGVQSKDAINSEANALVDEIERLYNTSEYNGIKLFENGKNNEICSDMPQAGADGFIKAVEKQDTSSLKKLSEVSSTADLADDTYSISSADELAKLAQMTNDGYISEGDTFVLAKDIDLAQWCADHSDEGGWTPIGNNTNKFLGTFNGNGYKISNMKIDRDGARFQGLFGRIDGTSSISNLAVVNAEIIVDDLCAGLLLGGATGSTDTLINNCYSTGKIDGAGHNGGIAGQGGNAINCYSTCDVDSSGKYSGSLYGLLIMGGTIDSCFAVGDVNSSSTHAGCLVGQMNDNSKIKNSYATGNVNANSNLGGLVGLSGANNIIENCYAIGYVNSSGHSCGGLIGFALANSIVENCYATGDVTTTATDFSQTGGLIGVFKGSSITNCYATGDVKGLSVHLGGLIGIVYETTAIIDSCYATGDVNGNSAVGGFIGSNYENTNTTITNSYCTGNVSGTGNNIGGFAGYVATGSTAVFDNCYTKSSINAGSGFLGYMGGTSNVTMRNCSVLGDISGTKVAVLLSRNNSAGKGTLIIENCQYNSELNNSNLPLVISAGNQGNLDITDDTIRSQVTTCGFITPFDFSGDINVGLQVGIDSTQNSRINLTTNFELSYLNSLRQIGKSDGDLFRVVDHMLNTISDKQTQYGAVQNRLESALDEIAIQYDNLASSRSTLRDADMAELSSEYIKMQILQQASATLLATANQSPSIALQLI